MWKVCAVFFFFFFCCCFVLFCFCFCLKYDYDNIAACNLVLFACYLQVTKRVTENRGKFYNHDTRKVESVAQNPERVSTFRKKLYFLPGFPRWLDMASSLEKEWSRAAAESRDYYTRRRILVSDHSIQWTRKNLLCGG